MSASDLRPSSRGVLLVALVVAVAGELGPIAHYALYPFTLLATWVHETGHGLAALALGGEFRSLHIFGDASGFAEITAPEGALGAIVGLGGLLAPPIVGASILFWSRGPRRARLALGLLALAMIATTVLWVRTVVGLIVVPAVAVVLLVFVCWGSGRERMFVGQLIGLRLALDTLTRGLGYLFVDKATVDGKDLTSDIAGVAHALGGPRVLWSVIVAAVSLFFVALGLWLAWRRGATSGRENA